MAGRCLFLSHALGQISEQPEPRTFHALSLPLVRPTSTHTAEALLKMRRCKVLELTICCVQSCRDLRCYIISQEIREKATQIIQPSEIRVEDKQVILQDRTLYFYLFLNVPNY